MITEMSCLEIKCSVNVFGVDAKTVLRVISSRLLLVNNLILNHILPTTHSICTQIWKI